MGRRHHLSDSLEMGDRERLLTVVAMFGTSPFGRNPTENPVQHGWEWRRDNIRPGDLVQCQTQRAPSLWSTAWLDDIQEDPHWGRVFLLRELGGERRCRMSNENVYALRGVPSHLLLEGLQWRAYVKISKAFSQLDSYHVKPAGLTFPDRHSRSGTIAVRPHMFRVATGKTARPIEIQVRFSPRTRIRDIATAIDEATPEGCWTDRMEER